MHKKQYPIQIWFLDDDLTASAQMLSNKYLMKTISGCMTAIISTYFYFSGIRNKKFYNYFFDKVRVQDTMDKYFPLWPLKQKPTFFQYTSKQSKWTRKCREHFDYVKKYMSILITEYEYRFKKVHGLSKFLEWLEFDAPKINIPLGKLKKITLEWKVLPPFYRKKVILDGYKAFYKHKIKNDGLKIDDFSGRDIPEFLLDDHPNKYLE